MEAGRPPRRAAVYEIDTGDGVERVVARSVCAAIRALARRLGVGLDEAARWSLVGARRLRW